MSEESEFDWGEDILEEEDICDYNGEPCFGDRMFCEECLVLKDDDDWKPRKKNWCEVCKTVQKPSKVKVPNE